MREVPFNKVRSSTAAKAREQSQEPSHFIWAAGAELIYFANWLSSLCQVGVLSFRRRNRRYGTKRYWISERD